MPLCRSFLDRYQETVEEYQLRRLLAIIVDKIKHGERLPHVYELERSAGLSKKRIRKPAAEVIRVDIPRIIRQDKFSRIYQASRIFGITKFKWSL